MKKAVPAGRQGFTLIEVLVSLALILIVSSGFFYFFKVGLATLERVEEFESALNSAQLKLEELRARPFEDIKNEAGIAVRPVTDDLKEIHLTVKWNNGRKNLELYTLRAR